MAYYVIASDMRVKNRSRDDLIFAILMAARDGTSNTQLMYKTLTSFHQVREYSLMLVKNGLLLSNSAKHNFTTTEKGLHFCEVYDQMRLELEPQKTGQDERMKVV
jgi:predicted transcriptional regulator